MVYTGGQIQLHLPILLIQPLPGGMFTKTPPPRGIAVLVPSFPYHLHSTAEQQGTIPWHPIVIGEHLLVSASQGPKLCLPGKV